jgi:hypothetical protein
MTDRLREHGFDASILVTEDFLQRCREARFWDASPDDVDANGLVRDAAPYLKDMISVASLGQARRLGLIPSFRFIAWEARKTS